MDPNAVIAKNSKKIKKNSVVPMKSTDVYNTAAAVAYESNGSEEFLNILTH